MHASRLTSVASLARYAASLPEALVSPWLWPAGGTRPVFGLMLGYLWVRYRNIWVIFFIHSPLDRVTSLR